MGEVDDELLDDVTCEDEWVSDVLEALRVRDLAFEPDVVTSGLTSFADDECNNPSFLPPDLEREEVEVAMEARGVIIPVLLSLRSPCPAEAVV